MFVVVRAVGVALLLAWPTTMVCSRCFPCHVVIVMPSLTAGRGSFWALVLYHLARACATCTESLQPLEACAAHPGSSMVWLPLHGVRVFLGLAILVAWSWVYSHACKLECCLHPYDANGFVTEHNALGAVVEQATQKTRQPLTVQQLSHQ